MTYTVQMLGEHEEMLYMGILPMRWCMSTLMYAGHINCFFNNAGIQGDMAPVHQQSSEVFRKVIEVNVVGTFFGLKHVSAAMADSGGGVIVNSASLAGMVGPRYMAAYAASKHAVIGLTKTAAKDLAASGVRVCAVSPGLVEGHMWATQVEGKARCDILTTTGTVVIYTTKVVYGVLYIPGECREVSEKEKREMENHLLAGTPLGRLGQLSEVANAVLFLCSEEASYLTGTVLTVDGGRLP